MRELFNDLPEQKHKTFKRHFLKSVHCEIGIAGISTDAILSKEDTLKEKLAPLNFKNTKKLHEAQFLFKPSEKDTKVANKSTPLGLVFYSEKPKRELQILNNKIVISDHNYDGFSSFLPTFKEITKDVFDSLNINEDINKVGLRKINTIFVEEAKSYREATEIFNPVVFGIQESGLIAQDAMKGIENLIVLEKDKKTFVLRSRVARQPQPDLFEANLDFDLVNQNLISFDDAFSNLLPEMNAVHFDLFIWAVSEEFIKAMEA